MSLDWCAVRRSLRDLLRVVMIVAFVSVLPAHWAYGQSDGFPQDLASSAERSVPVDQGISAGRVITVVLFLVLLSAGAIALVRYRRGSWQSVGKADSGDIAVQSLRRVGGTQIVLLKVRGSQVLVATSNSGVAITELSHSE